VEQLDSEDIARFLEKVAGYEQPEVTFLAAGEYNENYRVRGADFDLVFRVNHGTQLGLSEQVEYEFAVLEAVAPSGVTPKPVRCFPKSQRFPNGALLMEYLPGRSLDYERDWQGAASCFAAIHGVPADTRLIRQEHPVADIVAECNELLGRFENPKRAVARRAIEAYKKEIETLARSGADTFDAETHCITNTEVNSGNFIVDDDRVRLVDWEKAVVSFRYQDLGHFLVPTTTLWKSDYEFDDTARRAFLEHYHEQASPPVSVDALDEYTSILERTILLRAYSWCYMATAEYARGDRPLMHEATLRTMNFYLDNTERFLGV
jgi:hypothetical protein